MRFISFKGNWNRYCVSDLLESVTTNSLTWDDLNFNNGVVKNIHYGLIHKGFTETCISDTNSLIPWINEEKALKNYTLIGLGDLILADASEDRKDVGKPIEIVKTLCATVSGLHTIHAKDKTDFFTPGYKGFYFQSSPMKNQIFKIANGSKIYGISPNTFNELYMSIPTKDEQSKIVDLLTKIEERISTQNKIIEDLIALRKSIIERTFSLVNSSWNKFTFNDIFIERKEMHIKDSSVIHATLSKEGIFPKTDRYDRDFLVKDEDKKYKVSYLNDICYNPANLKFGVITRNNYGKCIISPIYVTYEVKPSFNPKFIELFVTRSAFLKEIRKYEQGTVYERMAVSSDDFLTYTTRLPDVDFQNEIVSKIDLFDKKITQEKLYLELLKNQKNYLLSNLFI